MASGYNVTNYLCSDKGIILPLVSEFTWNQYARAVLYGLGLLWSFMGVSIIADVFMSAIEKITSHTRKIKIYDSTEGGETQIEVAVWNDTVANLTLMALGSSAPEILLSIIEIVGNGFKSGDLGPGTIVGSAAFNLLVITAVCVMAIDAEGKRIYQIKVFFLTAFFSIFAYIWLVVILVGITPNYVDLWEGVVTLLFFPVLVIVAYIIDKDFCGKKVVDEEKKDQGMGIGNDSSNAQESEIRDLLKDLGKDTQLTDEEIQKILLKRFVEKQHHSRAWYRINASRGMFGGHKLDVPLQPKLQEKFEDMREGVKQSKVSIDGNLSEGGTKSVIEFTSSSSAVLERDQRVRLGIQRSGLMTNRVHVRVETVDGTATKGEDYVEIKKTIVFEPDEKLIQLDVEIIDDDQWEPDEVFFVKLSLEDNQDKVVLGNRPINQVTIINDDEPGTFQFAKPSFLFKESCGTAQIPVTRENGADGICEVKWIAESMTAREGRDFIGTEGKIVFESGELTRPIEIPIIDDQEKEKDENFRVKLVEVSEGAKLGRIDTTIITIVNDDDFNGLVNRLTHATNMNLDAVRVDTATWGDQFNQAMNVNGGDVETATSFDYVMHFFTFGWKVIFALVPPPSIWGGWLCFICSLGMIAILTAVVGDLASIFGCLINLRDPVTAITLVALGTSLPDLFASKQAATQDKYADNCIGNVTGSNSVNVFLGLGLPWCIASVYWTLKGEVFEVRSGSLTFSVILYAVLATMCIILLMMRRYISFFGKAELGGPKNIRIACGIFMISMWFIYVIVSSLQTYTVIKVEL